MNETSIARLSQFETAVSAYATEFSELMDRGKAGEEVPKFALLALRGGRCGLANFEESGEAALAYLERNGDLMTQVRLVDLDTGIETTLERKWVGEVETRAGISL